MKPFRILTIIIFAALALVGVLVFATYSSRGGDSSGEVVVWGTLPDDVVEEVLRDASRDTRQYDGVSYREMPAEGFSSTLVDAIASGSGPDLILVSSEVVFQNRDKLFPISYRSFSRRDFQDTYIESAEIFLANDGIYGIPFSVDPFVTFWNRTIFSEAGIPRAPRYWDEYSDVAPQLSQVTQNGTIQRSAVALGEWSNIPHAKKLFLSLMRGLGNEVIQVSNDGSLRATISEQNDEANIVPGQSALRFFTDFSDPVKIMYSWNRSQQNALDEFVAGRLAVYFGRASEVFSIRAANPNLNFDVARYPEIRNGRVAVPSVMHVFAVPRGSNNKTGAAQVAFLLSGDVAQASLNEITGLPSVKRDFLSSNPENPYASTFSLAALNSFLFRDVDAEQTDQILEAMVEAVSSGRLSISEAVSSAQAELERLVK